MSGLSLPKGEIVSASDGRASANNVYSYPLSMASGPAWLKKSVRHIRLRAVNESKALGPMTRGVDMEVDAQVDMIGQ